MKYSILGFNQEQVINLQKVKNNKVIKLDVVDLLILQNLSNYANRESIVKYNIGDKVYFSVHYSAIIEDLPIISIQKQALADRLDKMVFLGVLEKQIIKSNAGTFTAFRMGEMYEKLIFEATSSEIPVQQNLDLHSYSTTTQNTHIGSIDGVKKEKDKDKSLSTTKEKDEDFEQCWLAYRRKGSKAKSHKEWKKLTAEDKLRAKKHIWYYVESVTDVKYQKDFERYLRDKCFLNVVYKDGKVIFDCEIKPIKKSDDKLIIGGIEYK